MSLSEFHNSVAVTQDDTSSGPSNQVRMNWADEMDKLTNDESPNPTFVFDRSVLPTAPKSILKPDIDLELVPKTKPFRAFIANISFEADEEKVKSFFKELKVVHIHLATDPGGRSKGSGYIDFDDRDSLIAALNKNETTFINRPLRISLNETSRGYERTGGYGERREGGDRYGNRQQSNDSGALRSDESSWRRTEPDESPAQQQHSYGGQGGGRDSYSNQSSDQGGNRYGQRYQNSGGAGGNSTGGGYQQRRFNNQSGPSGSGGYDRRNRTDEEGGSGRYGGQNQQQRRPYGNNQYNQQNKQYEPRSSHDRDSRDSDAHGETFMSREPQHHPTAEKAQSPASFSGGPAVNTPPPGVSPTTSISEVKERPKLNLMPRTLPVEENTPVATSSIFGGAKPVNTAAREREIEERLKKERALALEKEKERQAAAAAAAEASSPPPPHPAAADQDDSVNQSQNHDDTTESTKQSRSHKTSIASDDSHAQHNRSHNNDFDQGHSGKPKSQYHQQQQQHNYNKNDNNNNNRNNISQSSSFTSPSSMSNNQQHRHHQHSDYKSRDSNEPRPAENAWKNRNASDLFAGEKPPQVESSDMSRTNNTSNNSQVYNNNNSSGGNDRRNYNNNNEERRNYTKRPDSQQQNRNFSGRDGNKDGNRRQGGSGGGTGYDRGGKQMGRNSTNQRPYNDRTRSDRPQHHGNYDGSTNVSVNDQHDSNQDLGFNNKFANLKVDVD